MSFVSLVSLSLSPLAGLTRAAAPASRLPTVGGTETTRAAARSSGGEGWAGRANKLGIPVSAGVDCGVALVECKNLGPAGVVAFDAPTSQPYQGALKAARAEGLCCPI